MSNQTVYRLADHVTCRSTNTDLKMLFDRKRGVMYELNETASSIVGLLDAAPRDFDQLLEALLTEYEAPVEEMRADVEQLLNDFVQADLLVPASAVVEGKE